MRVRLSVWVDVYMRDKEGTKGNESEGENERKREKEREWVSKRKRNAYTREE